MASHTQVLTSLFNEMTKLAPALCVGRNTGDKVTSANVTHSFNLVAFYRNL